MRPGQQACATVSRRCHRPRGSEAMVEDLSAVTGSVAKVGGQIAVVVAPERAITLSLRLPRDPPFAIYGSPGVDADDVIAIAAGGLQISI
jgi:hypothetical protein